MANVEAPAIKLSSVTALEMTGWIKNVDERKSNDSQLMRHKIFRCFAKVKYPRLAEGQKLEIGLIQTIYHLEYRCHVIENGMVCGVMNDILKGGKQLLDNMKPGLYPYSPLDNDHRYIYGPAKAGTAELTLEDQPGCPIGEGLESLDNHLKFNVYLVARDCTRIPRMCVLKALKWESLSHWEYDGKVGDMIFKGPRPPYKQPEEIPRGLVTLSEDVVRGKTAKYEEWDYYVDTKHYEDVRKRPKTMNTNFDNRFLDYTYGFKLTDFDEIPIIPVNLESLKLIFSVAFFSTEIPSAPPFSDAGVCFHAHSPAFVSAAIVRIPRLVKGQVIRLKWILARSTGFCYNAYKYVRVSWEFSEMVNDEEPMMYVPVEDDGTCIVEGPTYATQDITVTFTFKMHMKAPTVIDGQHFLTYIGAFIKFYSFLVAEDITRPTLVEPHCLLKKMCVLSLNLDRCWVLDIPYESSDLRELQRTNIDLSQFLVWRPLYDTSESKLIVLPEDDMTEEMQEEYLETFSIKRNNNPPKVNNCDRIDMHFYSSPWIGYT